MAFIIILRELWWAGCLYNRSVLYLEWRWYCTILYWTFSLPANQLITLLRFSHWVTSSQCQGPGGQAGLDNKVLLVISILWFPPKLNYLEPEKPGVSSFSCVILPGIIFQKIKLKVRTTSCLCEDMIFITCLSINIALSSSLLQSEVNLPGHLKSRESNWFQLSGQQWSALLTAQLSLIYIVLQSGHHLTTFTK